MLDENNKWLLAIDSSTETNSIALYNGNQLFIQSNDQQKQKHSDLLLKQIDKLLREREISIQNISHLAVGEGPGSFNGIRTAICLAQGISLVHQTPIIPISNLEAMAYIAYQKTNHPLIISMIDARMKEIYLSAYQMPKDQIIPPCIIQPEKIGTIPDLLGKNWYVIGSGIKTYHSQIKNLINIIEFDQNQPIQAGVIAQLAWERKDQSISHQQLKPTYLRDKIATNKNKKNEQKIIGLYI